MLMLQFKPSALRLPIAMFAVASGLLVMMHSASAVVSSSMYRSLAFPLSLANGVSGNLVPPTGSTTKLNFETGKVAIGELPVPLPQRAGRRGRAGDARPFFRPSGEGPHIRLLLDGVTDANGAVTNSGNQVMVDAVVSPSTAALNGPPFIIPFDIRDGTAFVDALLPVQRLADGSARVQILGVSVVDPEGQPFGVLGFLLPQARPTPVLLFTPTPGSILQGQGQCFVGRADCTGPSYAASQDQCCRRAKVDDAGRDGASWCPAEQFDPSTGRCLSDACIACPTPPPQNPPTPSSGPCADTPDCTGSCSITCADGTTVAGGCVGGGDQACRCDATCRAPTPCGAGQCFDTLTFRCTGQACGPGLRCPLPNQLCDVGGRFCPCEPAPPPAPGRICCQCKDPSAACFDFQFVEVQPICPPGCETFVGQECDARTDHCVPLTPCVSDTDCDDQNGCTRDRCTADGCVHDCVCVGPRACGPGPLGRGHRP
jgi:hypothetical protein